MIDWLEINRFAIAEHIELEFDDRFTTVTGETGSGKSLIVDAISILLGHRSDNSYIHHAHDSALIQAGFSIPDGHPAMHWLHKQDMAMQNECILKRILRRNKPSRGYINGHAVTATQLKSIGRELVDIHGQNEHHSLLKKSTQLHLLDSAADNLQPVAELGRCHDVLQDISEQISRILHESDLNRDRSDLLKFQISELAELNPQPGEWEELEMTHKRLNNQQELTTGLQQIADELYESDGENITGKLLRHVSLLEHLCEYANDLAPIGGMLGEARITLQEAAIQLRPFYRDMDINPEEMETIEARFSQYHSLARKHRVEPDRLFEYFQTMKKDLDNLENPEHELQRLRLLYATEAEKYQEIAGVISASRRKTAAKLVEEVTEIMQELGMRGGQVDIRFTPSAPDSFTRHGNESVEILVSANPGHPLQPLNKVASGGELSRVSLAIQVVLARKAQVPTLIFDEVDSGIGGEVANEVGRKLKTLGHSAQVICITHLSQVAARGDHHFHVIKQQKNGQDQVSTTVTRLTLQQRIEELARMSGGRKITEHSMAHAREMLESS